MKSIKDNWKFALLMLTMISGFVYVGSGREEVDEFEFHPSRPFVINKRTGEIHVWNVDSLKKDSPGFIVRGTNKQ